MSTFVNNTIGYAIDHPKAVIDKLRESAVGQVTLFREQDLSDFVDAIQSEISGGSAAYAIKADPDNKRVLIRNHADTDWVNLFSLKDAGVRFNGTAELLYKVTTESLHTSNPNGTTETAIFSYDFPASDLPLAGDFYEANPTGFETGPSNLGRRIIWRLGPTASALTSRTIILDTGNITNNNDTERTNWRFGHEKPMTLFIVAGGGSGSVRPYGVLTWAHNTSSIVEDGLNSTGTTNITTTQVSDISVDLSVPVTLSMSVVFAGTTSGYTFGIRQGRLIRYRF
jgi:hypothetical protein